MLRLFIHINGRFTWKYPTLHISSKSSSNMTCWHEHECCQRGFEPCSFVTSVEWLEQRPAAESFTSATPEADLLNPFTIIEVQSLFKNVLTVVVVVKTIIFDDFLWISSNMEQIIAGSFWNYLQHIFRTNILTTPGQFKTRISMFV